MRTITRRLASIVTVAACAAVVAGGTAVAAPVNAPNAETITLDCGDAGTFDVVVNGNGRWGGPGHVVGSNAILIPVAFGESTFVVRDAEGNVIDESTEPAVTKGRARVTGRDRVTCTFTLTFTEDDLTITFSSSVTAFMAGPRS